MRNVFLLVFLLASVLAFSQSKPRESLEPTVTEIWDLKPIKVTPGKNPGEAPSDALIVFDGKDLSNFTALDGTPAKWEVKEGALTVIKGSGDIKTKKQFDDIQLHIEWRTPEVIVGEGQGRGNSGIFFQERYELQVLDSYESVTYSNGQAGSIYKQSIPLVNATLKPGEWQVYDVVYNAPIFSENGRVISPARITVLHNGVLIQNGFQIWGPMEFRGLPVYEPHGKASLRLQEHGNPVSYRNIWIREL